MAVDRAMRGLAIAMLLLLGGVGVPGPAAARADAKEIDLTRAVVVVPDGLSGPEEKAVHVLVEEVEARSGIRWDVMLRWPTGEVPVVAVGPMRLLRAEAGPLRDQVPPRPAAGDARDGYTIRTIADAARRTPPTVLVAGNDSRGVLFGVGRLVRSLRITRGKVALPDRIERTEAPKYPLRGHQLGYRPKTNSYDGWDLPQWDRYIRDLALFGTNAIELIPPRSDDDDDSPHFPRPPLEMMVGMSRIAADYGLDVWVWYPAMDPDYSNPKTVAHALEEWGAIFRALPRIDAVFVPGGDPGHTRPKYLMALLEKQAVNLRRYHPEAKMWVSPQSFSDEWLREFVAIVKTEPSWLAGVVFGPQVRISLPELRAAIPAKYPIRDYPDITHSLRCQYPVPDWDVAYALTEGREVINPRPRDESAIFHAFADQSVGSITYSEGCNDDVNKFVWSALGWDPSADLLEVLREYARCLIGLPDDQADGFARGLFALEQNWRGPLIANSSVETTLQQFRELERRASPRALANWRFQQALYRAYYDAFVRSRLIHETDLQERALDRLRAARATGSLAAMERAQSILELARTEPVAVDLRARVFELGEALFQSIRMQLSVPRYRAIAVGRGANLDTIDQILNDREWLERRFAAIRNLESEAERLKALDAIVDWTNPGPGGFYDDLGNPVRRPHLVAGPPYAEDPASLRGPMTAFDQDPGWRRSWCRHAGTLFGKPLRLHYEGLDREASYRVRVVYTGDMFEVRVRLEADGATEIHPYLLKPRDLKPVEFDVPRAATADGSLDLTWTAEPGQAGNGRGCQVAEVWLMRK
ncbi:MAG: hypothetical protein ACYC61_03720 [Isosphaeraceae bacterium]